MIALIVPLLVCGTVFWQSLCGNQRFEFYGRVVDERMTGVENVTVTARISYSPFIKLPVMYGQGEAFRTLQVVTDSNGDFCIGPVYGYAASLLRFDIGNRMYDSKPGERTSYRIDVRRAANDQFPATPQLRKIYTMDGYWPENPTTSERN